MSPCKSPRIGFLASINNLKKGSHGPGIPGEKNNLISPVGLEVHIPEQNFPVNTGTQASHIQNPVAHLSFGAKDYSGVLPGGRFNIRNVQLLDHFLAACCLLGFGHIGAEAGNEFQ